MKHEGIFKSLWSFNGVIHVKFTSNYDELPIKIFHFDAINYYVN